MIFSLFRNDKEVRNSEQFRVEAPEELVHFIEWEIWERFIQRHLDIGGIIPENNKTKFLQEAKTMGYSIKPVC